MHDEFRKIGQENLDRINQKLQEVTLRFASAKPLSISKGLSIDSAGADIALSVQKQDSRDNSGLILRQSSS